MSESAVFSGFRRIVGCILLLAGVAVFAIRLQHAGPYAWPDGGGLVAAILALLFGSWLIREWGGGRGLENLVTFLILIASPVVMFYALYVTFAELEEVVSLKVSDSAGRSVDLRLWVVDHEGVPWVTMPRRKADMYGLRDNRAELLRGGELRCVIVARYEDLATVSEIHRLRQQKYGVQRLATTLGIFPRVPSTSTVAFRLDPCSPTQLNVTAVPGSHVAENLS